MTSNKKSNLIIATKFKFLIFTLIFVTIILSLQFTTASVDLGTAEDFGVLAGSGITNTGPTTITGNVGTFPTITETGFGSVILNGVNHAGDAVTQGAKNDLVVAYNNVVGQTPVTTISTELGGTTKIAGVYDSADGTFEITGILKLDAQGNPDSVFIFKTSSTLITAGSSRVELLNGANPCNVFWQVGSSATLGTNSIFKGNILALQSITITTGADLEGRALARNGAVTLDSNTITSNSCTGIPTPICGDGVLGGTEQCESDGDCSLGNICNGVCSCVTSSCEWPDTMSRTCGLIDIGLCSYGTQTRTCEIGSLWGAWGACIGTVNPVTEICGDEKDNNCDGFTDEGCHKTVPIMNNNLFMLLIVFILILGLYGLKKYGR